MKAIEKKECCINIEDKKTRKANLLCEIYEPFFILRR